MFPELSNLLTILHGDNKQKISDEALSLSLDELREVSERLETLEREVEQLRDSTGAFDAKERY